MKELTPMKRYQESFNTFKSLMPSSTKEYSLNKSEPRKIDWQFRNNDVEYTKGIKSDFVRIYEGANNVSVAFTFTYIGKDQDDQMITPSVKNIYLDGSIIASEPIKAVDFSIKLKAFNKSMKDQKMKNKINEKGFVAFVEEFTLFFLNEKINLKEEMKKVDIKVKDFFIKANEKFDLKGSMSENDMLRIDYDTALEKSNKKIKSLPESKRKLELLKELSEIEDILKIKVVEIENKFQLKDKKSKLINNNRELTYKINKTKSLFDSEHKEIPVELRNEIKNNKLFI